MTPNNFTVKQTFKSLNKTEKIRERIIQKYPELYFGTVYRTREEKKWLMVWVMKQSPKGFTTKEMKKALMKFNCNLREIEIDLYFKELELQNKVILTERGFYPKGENLGELNYDSL